MSSSAFAIASVGGASVTLFTSQTSVTITHNWKTYPIVDVTDDSGVVLIPLTITHNSATPSLCTATTITFDVAKSGRIVLSYGAVPGPQGAKGDTGQIPALSGDVTTVGGVATISASAVTATKIAANAVNTVNIASNAVTADKIIASGVTETKLAANAVSYAKQGAEFKGDLTITANAIDWSTGFYKEVTLVADTTFTFTNLEKGKTIIIRMTGSFIPTFPASCELVNSGTYNGTKFNYIVMTCVNAASPKILLSINKTA